MSASSDRAGSVYSVGELLAALAASRQNRITGQPRPARLRTDDDSGIADADSASYFISSSLMTILFS